MRAPQFRKWFAKLPALNVPQRLQTLAALHPAAGLDQVNSLVDQVGASIRRCPSCACERYHRHGQANGLQRYRCRQCRRTYNDLSGTPLARLRLREKWLDYPGCVLDSTSVRAAATQLGRTPQHGIPLAPPFPGTSEARPAAAPAWHHRGR